MNLNLLLTLVLIAGVAGGSAVYVLAPERVEIVIPENVIIRRQGYIPLWVDGELTWIPENEALILVNKSGWENIELIWPEHQIKNITAFLSEYPIENIIGDNFIIFLSEYPIELIWPENSENHLIVENIVLIWPERTSG